MHLLYATGLRLSEVVAARIEDLQWVQYPSDVQDDEPLEGWVLTVLGKGQKEREVPVPQGVVDELRIYLFERGIGTPSTFGSGEAFLLGKVGEGVGPNGSRAIDVLQGIAATTLYDQIKAFFGRCASELLKDGDHKGAARLAKASTHWLRHTHASHAIAGGMPIEVAQQNLGHASLATTTVYVKTEEKRRMKAVKKFWEARAGR
jgi:site-specific recombinase XerD